MLTVFYDSRCGLCNREIAFYRHYSRPDSVLWLDIWQHETQLAALGLTPAQCLQQLHLLDEHQQLHTGVDAFILMWQTVPRLSILAKLATLAPVRGLLRMGYALFLIWYKRQPHVQQCILADKKE